jgi:hypothetical protein
MAFVVETGTGSSTANSLCSVADADAYFIDRKTSTWVGLAADKEAALVRATDFVELTFGHRFRGSKLVTTQALSFPRTGVNSDNVVPTKVKWAVAEYALRSLTGVSLLPDPTVSTTGQSIKRVMEKLDGVAEIETEYGSANVSSPRFPTADGLLQEYVRPGGRTYR